MGKVRKGVPCSVAGCSNPGVRSMSRNSLLESGLKVSGEGRRIYLCSMHYREWKKETKSSRELERARYD